MYDKIFKSPADPHVEFWDYTIHRANDVFWAIGRERGTYKDGDSLKEISIRTSRIFRMRDGRWRQVHHHGSIDNAKTLAEFQSAVRSPKNAPAPSASNAPSK